MKKYKSIVLIVLVIGSVLSIAFFCYIQFVHAFSWTITDLETGSPDDSVGTSMSMKMESSSKVHFAYCNATTNTVYYNSMTNGSVDFTPQGEQISDTVINCYHDDIDLQLDGSTPEVVFVNGNGATGVYFAKRDGGGSGTCTDTDWNCYTLDSTYKPRHISFKKLGSRYGIVFQDMTSGDIKIVYGTCTSSCTAPENWTFEGVDGIPSAPGEALEFDYLSDGTPVIAYTDNISKLRYAIRDGSGSGNCTDLDWNCYEVDNLDVTYQDYISLAVNSNDEVAIVYPSSTTRDARYAILDGGNTGCTGDETSAFTCEDLKAGIDFIWYSSIEFRNNVPLIGWQQYDTGDSGYSVMFSYKTTSTWNHEVVDTVNTQVGRYTSIGYAGDEVGIAYYDNTSLEATFATADAPLESPPTIDVTISTSTPNGDQIVNVDLSDGVTTSLYVYGEITDNDGCSDISTDDLVMTFYRSGMTSSTGCFHDEANCYQLSLFDGGCSTSGCGGGGDVSLDYSCTVDVEHFADPTDAGVFSDEHWVASVSVSDIVNGAWATSTQMTEINSLSSLSLSATIDYGTLVFGTTSTEDAVLVVTNSGNTSIDLEVSGTDFSCTTGSVEVDLQRFSSSSGVAYESMYQSVSSGLEFVGFDLAPQTVSTTAATSGLYFKMYTTSTHGLAGSCTGTTSVMATLDI